MPDEQPDESAPAPTPPAPDPVTGERRAWRRDLVIALVAVGAAVLGSLSGGVATYLGTVAVEDRKAADQAQSVGRVLMSDLATVEGFLEVEQETGYGVPSKVLQVHLTAADRKVLAGEVSSDEWWSIWSAVFGLQSYVQARASLGSSPGHGVKLSKDDLTFSGHTLVAVRDAVDDLKRVAELDIGNEAPGPVVEGGQP